MRKTAIIISILTVLFSILLIALPKKSVSKSERRTLAEFPDLSFKTLTDGSAEIGIAAYLSDHFPFRDACIGTKTLFEEYVLQKKLINGVYIAKDGYRIEQYRKPENTDKIIDDINSLVAKTEGKNVYLMLVPTASVIYADKLPYKGDGKRQLEELEKYYSKTNTKNINVTDTLLEHASEKQLYYKLDHHWTTEAVYLAYFKYCETLSFEPADRSEFDIEKVTDDFKGTIYSKINDVTLKGEPIYAWRRDNSALKNPESTGDKVLYDPTKLAPDTAYAYFLGEDKSINVIENTAYKGEERSLVLIKDSYANCFVPFLTEHYSKIYIIDPRSYTGSNVALINGDDTVKDVLLLYNMNTIDQDSGVKGIDY